jgi:hypothetical protein
VKAVPVNELLVPGIVPHIDDQWPPFRNLQERARHLTVVGQRFHGSAGTQFDRRLGDAKRHIGRSDWGCLQGRLPAHPGLFWGEAGRQETGSGQSKKLSPSHNISTVAQPVSQEMLTLTAV